jgi:hypothetical protein
MRWRETEQRLFANVPRRRPLPARQYSSDVPDPSGSGIELAGEGLDFDLSAAALRASSGDLRTFVDVLAEKLDRALPGRVRVQRRAARLLSKEKHVTAIELDLGETRYLLAAQDGVVETRCATAVRGIVLKSEAVSLDAWIDGLLRELENEARTSEQSRLALEQLVKG